MVKYYYYMIHKERVVILNTNKIQEKITAALFL